MKVIFLLTLLVVIACTINRQIVQSPKKLEIMQTDTTIEFYVFKTINASSKEVV
jgi:hypothetical protein